MYAMKHKSRCYTFKTHTNPRKFSKIIQQSSNKRNNSERKKRKTHRLSGEGILQVIKSISTSSHNPNVSLPNTFQLIKSEPKKAKKCLNLSENTCESIIDLTQSETNLSSNCTYLDSSSIIGDNTKNILTIYPPKPNLFSSPSEELSVLSVDLQGNLSRKRSRSMSNITSDSQVRLKKLARSRSKIIETELESLESGIELKRTVPLENFEENEIKSMILNDDFVNMEIIDTTNMFKIGEEKDGNIDEDMKSLKVTDMEK